MVLLMARSATVALLVATVIRACVASTGIEVGLRQYGGRTVAEAGTGFLNTAVFEAAVAAIEEALDASLQILRERLTDTGFFLCKPHLCSNPGVRSCVLLLGPWYSLCARFALWVWA